MKFIKIPKIDEINKSSLFNNCGSIDETINNLGDLPIGCMETSVVSYTKIITFFFDYFLKNVKSENATIFRVE